MLSAIRGIHPAAASEVNAELCSLLACSVAEVDEHVALIDTLVASTTAATPEKSENNNPATTTTELPVKKPYQMDGCSVHGGL